MLKFTFPNVTVQPNRPEDTTGYKFVKFISPEEFPSFPDVNEDKIKQFTKKREFTLSPKEESKEAKVSLIDVKNPPAKLNLEFKSKIIVEATEKAASEPTFAGALSELLSSSYEFTLKSEKDNDKQQPEVFVVLDNQSEGHKAVELARGRSLARELANQRGNVGTTEFMEAQAEAIANEHGLSLRVIRDQFLQKEGFKLMHAVGRASVHKPRLVNLLYQGAGHGHPWIAFVGKGLCFDSGGLNIKVGGSMFGMHLDKHGGCSVISAIATIAKLKIPINVTASVGFVENSINENAYRPGDIFESRKGLTVEIGNTDAEGRLVLADVMNWTQQMYSPKVMIELSTLTGAMIVALGNSGAGVFSNDEDLVATLKQAGKEAKQPVWHMPIWEEHRNMIRPSVADLTNSAGKPAGGSSQAAAFLEAFVEKGVSWAHIDIAGASMDGTMATGYGARLLVKYAELYAKNAQSK